MIETVRSHAMSKEGNYASFPHKLHIKINVQSNRKEKSTQKFDNEATKSVNLDFPTFLLPTWPFNFSPREACTKGTKGTKRSADKAWFPSKVIYEMLF